MAQQSGGGSSQTKLQLAIAALLVFIVVGLVGGIIWYNFEKTTSLTVVTAERLLGESGDDTVRRIELFYEPVLAIVALASRVPQISEMTKSESAGRLALVMTGLRRYPQLFSLYVGYDDGDFDMVTRIGGAERSAARKALGAPDTAFFAHETIETGSDGVRRATWTYLAEDGSLVEQRAATATTYDPRVRQWYRLASADDKVHRSELYIFASSQELGITISRKLEPPTAGVFGADLAVREVSSFLATKKIAESSEAFVFNSRGEILAFPDESKIQRVVRDEQESTLVPTTVASLDDPVISALFEGFQRTGGGRMTRLDVKGRVYLSQVVPIMGQLGGSDYLGMVVPVDEITGPIDSIRSEALFYSVVVLLLVLPLYVVLLFFWVDRRLGRASISLSDFKDTDPQ